MLQWGFIGCGDVVQKKSGVPFWVEGQSAVRAVCCRNITRARKYAKMCNIPCFYDDVNAIFADDAIDAVYIATPPSTHMLYAKQALLAGKAVYVEKPLGLSVAECEEVLAIAKEKGLPVFSAFYRRGLPMFQDIKTWVKQGEIGTVRMVTVKQCKKEVVNATGWRREPSVSGGGLFHDLGCHTLDILDYLIAPITQVSGFHANQRGLYACDDAVTATFRFENGVLGTGSWCFDTVEDADEVVLIGDVGKIVFPVYGNWVQVVHDWQVETHHYTHPIFVQEPLIHNMISALQGGATALSTGESALRTVQVMEQIIL